MTRWLPALLVAVPAFAAILALQEFALRAGFLPDESIMLWAGAIAAGDGEVPLGRIVAAYPTIPFLATTLMEVFAPAGTPTPALLAALVFAAIVALCFRALIQAGLGVAVALAASVLIAFHPALLRAAVAGPAHMFLAVFLLLLAKGLYDLRAQSAAPEVMTVALALLGLTFSHPIGAAIAAASVPFLVLAVRPALVANSALNVVVALVFPTVFCVGAFTYVSWVFPGSGWTFLTAPAESSATWAASVTRMPILGSLLTLETGVLMALALMLAAPLALAAAIWVRRRRPLVAPLAVLLAATIFAAMIAVATGVFGEPAAAIVAAPIAAAVVLMCVPAVRERVPAVLALLVLGWIGGAVGVALIDPRVAQQVGSRIEGVPGERDRIDALNLGRVTAGLKGVLVDTVNAPAVVLGRGEARGLFAPHSEAFALTMLFARIDAPYVALPDPQSTSGAQDQLNKLAPKFFRFGASGYRLVYQNATWRLFERIATHALSND